MEKKKKNIAPKKKKEPVEFWNALVGVWFSVYANLIPPVNGEKAQPSFADDPAERTALRLIIQALKGRCKVEWSEKEATIRLDAFLRMAHLDRFISDNYMLRIINLNKTKIFNKQITPKYFTNANGQNREGGSYQGSFSKGSSYSTGHDGL